MKAMTGTRPRLILMTIYRRLFERFGPQGWWPGESPFEVAVGAILTQNTNWANVEKAISNLKSARVLSPRRLFLMPERELAALIRPSGYYNVKARRLKALIAFIHGEYGGDLQRMFKEPLVPLRERILMVKGVGPETCDSILLYAAGKPIFVIDAYTKRVLSRHGMISDGTSYSAVQELFMRGLPTDVALYKEYHALFVRLAKSFCKTKPQCAGCPLEQGWST